MGILKEVIERCEIWKGYVRLKLDFEFRGNLIYFVFLVLLGFYGILFRILSVREYFVDRCWEF